MRALHGREPSSARQLISVNVCIGSSLGIEGPNAGKAACVRSRDPSGFLDDRRLPDEGLGEAAEPSCTLSVSGTLSVLGVRRRAPPSCPEPDPPRAKLVFWFRHGVGDLREGGEAASDQIQARRCALGEIGGVQFGRPSLRRGDDSRDRREAGPTHKGRVAQTQGEEGGVTNE